MIDQLRSIAIFAKVAEEGSFSGAARDLRISTSVVSQHVSKLERDLGVTLLYRTTRAISLTHEGQTLLLSAKEMIDSVQRGLNDIRFSKAEPAGSLKVTMPGFVRRSKFESALWSFARKYRSVAITLSSGDKPLDLIREGYDLALRLGEMRDSTLRSKKIGEFERKLVASPSYLAKVGTPTGVRDLQQFDFISMKNLPEKIELWKDEKKEVLKDLNSRIFVDSVANARSAVIGGMGIQRLPVSEIANDLREGTLVEVLPDWSLKALPIYVVWPGNSVKSDLRQLLIDWIMDAEKTFA